MEGLGGGGALTAIRPACRAALSELEPGRRERLPRPKNGPFHHIRGRIDRAAHGGWVARSPDFEAKYPQRQVERSPCLGGPRRVDEEIVMPGRMEFELSAGRPPARRRAEGAAMRLLVMGDFSGLPAAERPPLATRPIHAVDVDSLDVVLRRLAPRATTVAGACRFESIDDFHPDALLQHLPTLAALRAQRDGPPPAAGEDPLSILLGRKAAPDAVAPAVAAPAPTGL
ncbi:MAG: type VI secretion system contractile sheath small subunit, partial [Rubrivivax sp.]